MLNDVTFLLYLIAAILFVVGLKRMQSVSRSRLGNAYAALGMALAVLATLGLVGDQPNTGWGWIVAGIVIGAAVGTVAARRVRMTAMPQMVALFNGFGGAASALVACTLFFGVAVAAFADLSERREHHERAVADAERRIERVAERIDEQRAQGRQADAQSLRTLQANRDQLAYYRQQLRPTLGTVLGSGLQAFALALSVLIGFTTFSGSLLAFGKLQGISIKGRKLSDSIRVRNFRTVGLVVLTVAMLVALLLAFALVGAVPTTIFLIVLGLLALGIGLLIVLPIGGADMPVVISLLNSYSGVAAAMSGLAIGGNRPEGLMLIVGGALVGAAGLILTRIMCRAMNRSLLNVITGGWTDTGDVARYGEYENIREAQPIDAALALLNAREVLVVPGFGMAVAHAQHAIRDLYDELSRHGVYVRFGIHPVAGRMPGHMNVLLAEAEIPYDRMSTLDETNRDIATTDVVLVIGANDVVNPSALTDPQSPLAGMPILNAHEAQSVFVVKRSLSPGYAGVPNPLFENDRTRLIFGDAKRVTAEIMEEVAAQASVV